MKTFFEYIVESEKCDIVTFSDIKRLEKEFDKKFDDFDIDFKFTRHFADRMSDDRNKPCIDIKEIESLFNKIHLSKRMGRKVFSRWKDLEIVLNDVKTNINIPFAIEYDERNDKFNVIAKTIMRKRDFKSQNPKVKV
jgi:hypothetical protein